MNARKNCSLILAVFTLMVVLSACRTNQLSSVQQPNQIPAQLLIVDGSGPVPPLPPSQVNRFDGSGPVPPLPPSSELSIPVNRLLLVGDGSGPVPPLPPSQVTSFDGSGPVPPLPPNNIVDFATV